ncbi:hypothetical protein TWF481_008672 [Arthrobotrys musiformis]|uniref:Uncharacterized protein n=1 Tax=Arthrobotrys musiformis TaxID=47236 RepID=A0AAV9W9N0_9PEZI
MYFIKQAITASILVFSLQTTLVAGQSAPLVRTYIRSEKKIAENLSPLVDTLDYSLGPEKWTPVFQRVTAGVDALTRGIRLAERRFEKKLPRFDDIDTKEIEKDFLAFADEAVDLLATLTRKTRPAVNPEEESFQGAAKPFVNFEKSLKSYLPKLLDTIPSASESVLVSMQLLQDSVGGLVLIFDNTVGSGETMFVDTHGSGSSRVKIIIE